DLIGAQDPESLRRSIWKQFKESQASSGSKADAALRKENRDVEPLRHASTHLWTRGLTEGDLDAAIAFFVSEPGKSYVAAAEGFPGPYWRSLLSRPALDDPGFAKARRLVEAAGAADRCRSALAAEAAQGKTPVDEPALADAVARHYRESLDERARNAALAFFESGPGRLHVSAVRAQAQEGPALFRLWLTDWVAQTAGAKLAAAGGRGHVDKRRGYSIEPPPGWTPRERGGKTTFRDPGDASGLGPALTVRSEPRGGFRGFLEGAQRRLESSRTDFILRFKEDVQVDGRNAVLLTFLFKEKVAGVKEGFKALHLMVDDGKRAWTLTCEARAGDFEGCREACLKALNSFKVLEPKQEN
ncbi:MAG: hypothetical protein HY748_04985, partial [Elusimicrobia bacterium]|nr:hypothetical protein [Elusimicrobiota bacterium]